MTALLVAAALTVVTFLAALWRSRSKLAKDVESWKASAAEERQARAGAEAVVKEQGEAARETQASLEQELHDQAEARLRHPDASARVRVQERWAATEPGSDPTRSRPTLPDGPAGGPGTDSPPRADVRGRR